MNGNCPGTPVVILAYFRMAIYFMVLPRKAALHLRVVPLEVSCAKLVGTAM